MAREGEYGMETFISEEVFKLHSSYKNQLIKFLEQNLTLLKAKPEDAVNLWEGVKRRFLSW